MKNKIKENTFLISSIFVAILIVTGALFFSKNNLSKVEIQLLPEERQEYADNVSIVDGKQIIQIKAKGGFYPVHSIAKSDIPTILRIDTNGTFDCSSVIRVPSMNISRNLPMSGVTDINIGIQKVGKLNGTCGMGMYPFDVEFK